MNLGEAIVDMEKIGNQFASWYLIDTNIESIKLVGNNKDGYNVEVKVKE